jgi:hypothetical protein
MGRGSREEEVSIEPLCVWWSALRLGLLGKTDRSDTSWWPKMVYGHLSSLRFCDYLGRRNAVYSPKPAGHVRLVGKPSGSGDMRQSHVTFTNKL